MKRVLFKEEGWEVVKSNKFSYVEHLDCREERRGNIVDELATAPTYHQDRTCFHCDTEFPEFIRNMWIFTMWTLGIRSISR